MKFVVIGDLHLDQSTAGVDRYEDGCRALDAARDHACKIDADGLIFLGDLSDPHTVRVHRSLRKLAEVVHHLMGEGIDCLMLAGNHDVIEDGSGGCILDVLQWGDGIVLSRPQVLRYARQSRTIRNAAKHMCNLVALPFTPTSHNYDPAEFVRTMELDSQLPTLVIGHLNLQGIAVGSETTEMPRGRDVFWPIDALRARVPNAMLVGGHYHKAQTYQGVVIAGSAVRLRFDEKDNEPGFLVLEV